MGYRTLRSNGVLLIVLLVGWGAVAAPARGQAIEEDLKVLASDGAAEDEFGHAVAIDQGVVAVGAPKADDNGSNSGSAYLYDAFTGAQIAELIPSDGAAGDEFGFSIAIDGGIVAVGAWRDEHNGISSGSAYLFDATTGAELAKLTPDDGAAGDEFGFSIAIDGAVVVVGAKRDDDNGADSGSVYLFDVGSGAQVDKLVADDGTANDNFGGAVAIDGGVVAVGAHGDWARVPLSGSAYLFDAITGDQSFKLLADDGATNDFFGSAIDIDDGVVVVGAWSKSIVFDHSGAAYTFDAATGSQITRLVPSDSYDRDNFGITVSIDDGVVAVGAHQDDDNGFNSGSAYLFDAFSDTQIDKLLASDGAVFDLFGTSIAIDNGVVVVGAIGDEDSGSDSGSAYVFGSPVSTFRRGDANADGLLDVADPVFILAALFTGGPASTCAEASDANDDGSVDLADAVAALNALFGSGPGLPAPYPGCGSDPTVDSLTCMSYGFCP